MARVDFVYPWFFPQPTTTSVSGQRKIQAIGDYCACIRQAEEDATITKVGFYHDVRTGTPGDIRIGIQSVNTNGDPSGTWLGYTDYAATAGNFPNFASLNFTITANGTAAVTRGQLYAIVMYSLSGTWNATNNIQFGPLFTGVGQYATAFPTVKALIAGAASNYNGSTAAPCIYCESATATYGNSCAGPTNIGAWNANNVAFDELGVKFSLLSSWTTTYNVLGIQGILGVTNSAATATLKLYDSTNTVLQDKAFTATELYAGTTSALNRTLFFDESTLANLNPGDTYRITLEVTSAALGFTAVIQNNYPNNTVARSFVGSGTYIRTDRVNGGAWTDTDTACPAWKLIISEATSTGGGGTTVLNHIGMTGGIRG